MNLHLHFHMLALDGVYAAGEAGHPQFHALGPPDDAQVVEVAGRIADRTAAQLERRGLGPDADPEEADSLARDQPLLASLYGASVLGRIATGPHAGERVQLAGNLIEDRYPEALTGPRSATVSGFSLHANVAIGASDRHGLERLCRYTGRGPLATERLSRLPDGRLAYRFQRPWANGATQIILDPQEFIEKLAALVPPPRFHLAYTLKEDNARNTYLIEEEARKVLTCCSPQLQFLGLAAMHTGFRTSELRSLTWSHVDYRNSSLTVLSAYAKNDETRTVPMTPDLESVLRKVYDEREPDSGDPVFLNRDGKPWKSWRTAFKNALKAAGIEDFRFHDLRHCFGSYLGMNNTNPKAMMELMGHKRPEMTMRYTHLSVEYKREAVAKLPAFGNLETESPQISPSAEEAKVVEFGK